MALTLTCDGDNDKAAASLALSHLHNNLLVWYTLSNATSWDPTKS